MTPKRHHLTFFQFQQNSNPKKNITSSLFNISVKKTNARFSRLVILVPVRLDKRSSSRHQTKRIVTQVLVSLLPEFKNQNDILLKPKKILSKKEIRGITGDLRFAFRKFISGP
ncbi:hypothetical protein A2Y99_04145 [Candidatus Gottesmanbacteria bacterium RBG_13_37_7]|uniref:Uncharacterized protein n=1 Tax=Candidatus Gottesmanbacteria bacterium RBG_13_37_7 TaxID=1798369 RepID=A0A1F5YGF8_9BACT|nr:MAG: hypothetical protein A2Y99_04145 [Candidatus Gottesmanbacteria bacterium RBG_13_37_7]